MAGFSGAEAGVSQFLQAPFQALGRSPVSAQERLFPDVPSKVTTNGSQIYVNGEPFHMKGICWNPVAVGGGQADVDYPGYVDMDAKLMQEAGINVVRLYETLTDLAVMDTLYAHGIMVANVADNWGGASIDNIANVINPTKNHPGLLLWELGNEWNYNGFYTGLSLADGFQRVRDFAAKVKELDTNHPVSTVFGELPTVSHVAELAGHIDIWGLNIYRSNTFGTLFDDFKSRSPLPMYVGEYGADAWDSRNESGLVTQPYMGVEGHENFSAQADATSVLAEQINIASAYTGGPCNGGFVFELADEWWKSLDGVTPEAIAQRWVHDNTGNAPGGGPYPDQTFNEEWWGLCDINRTKRPAFTAYAAVANPICVAMPISAVCQLPVMVTTAAPTEAATTAAVTTAAPTQAANYVPMYVAIAGVALLGVVAITCAVQNSGNMDEGQEATEMADES